MKGRAQFFAVFPGFSPGRVLGAGDSGFLARLGGGARYFELPTLN